MLTEHVIFPEGSAITTWTYDAAGNILTEEETLGTSTIIWAWTYDDADNMATEEFDNSPPDGRADSRMTYFWDC